MIRLSAYPLILILFLSFKLSAQVDPYTDRFAWRQAVVDDICHTEDLDNPVLDGERFDMGTALQLSGFEIEQLNTANPGGVGSVNGNRLEMFVDADDGTEVIITFDEPVCGFFADYTSAASGEILMEVYNSSEGMIGSFTHTMDNNSRGIVSTDPTMPITMIAMRGTNPNQATSDGEVFEMDNIEIACCPMTEPIPTMGEWGLISLGLCMLILGVVAVGRRVAAAG